MTFKNDEPKYCDKCGGMIAPGERYYEYEGEVFCDRYCLGQRVIKDASNSDFKDFVKEYCEEEFIDWLLESTEFTEGYVKTAQDNAELYRYED